MKIKKILVVLCFSFISVLYGKDIPFILYGNEKGIELNVNEEGNLKIFFKNKNGVNSENLNGYYWNYAYSLPSGSSRKNFLEDVKKTLLDKEATVLYTGEDYLFFKLYNNKNLYWGKVVYFKGKYELELVEEKSLKVDKAFKNIVLKNLKFDSGKATLKKGAEGEIGRIVQFLVENSTYIVEIRGHTDSSGSSKANLLLSQKRATQVREALISEGISKDRVQSKGYGEGLPLWSNETKDGRYKNRRVELKVLSQ